jgi:hypothetical protein
MCLQDVLTVNDFPPVIAGADIAAFRSNPDSSATRDFLSGYLGFDPRAQHALHSTLASLASPSTGGAFWLNGVFGSGKSHLLGLLALLGEGIGLEFFAASHPDCAHYLQRFTPRLSVHISLDEFDAARLGLEEIFWREVEREWTRRGLGELQIERSGARAEAFAELNTVLQEKHLNGLVVCFDELSLFLGGREHNPLQSDAAFLQFLGGHSRRAPFWVFAALQKTIDDISGLESYSLSQIRDRFTLLPLSLANLPALVQKRLIRITDEPKVEEICAQTWAKTELQLPRLDFGPVEWRIAFPFHPATLTQLEAVTGRFFSRTRSAAIFCIRSLDLQRDATSRVLPDAIWDYFQPELEAHPDLRPLDVVWRAWAETSDHIFAPNDRENGLRAMKWVLLCKIAGQSPTPIQLANALDFPLDLQGDGVYEYARFLLERLRTRGAYLAVERGETPLQDRYTIDLGKRVSEMARRQISAALESIPPGDARIAVHVLGCCRTEPLPLSELAVPRSLSIFWQGAPRKLSVQVWDGAVPQLLANRAAQTREYGTLDDAVLAILPPFGQGAGTDAALSLLEEGARPALWFWKPRAAARDEWELAREAAAASLVASDPVLADNRRGRALLEHLQKEAPARDSQLARIALRLLLEGELLLGNGAVLEASELSRGENFCALVEAVGDFAWPQLFPRFTEIAPRARLLTPSNADSLCLEILRRPASEPYFAASLERLARHIGEPLGVAKSSGGRWKIGGGKAEVAAQILAFLGEGAPFSALEAHFAKSEWGLRPEQVAVLTCALLRSGEVAAFDGQNQELASERIGLPLRRSVYYLRPGRLPEAENWTKIAVLLKELCGTSVGAPSFTEAQKASASLLEWRETMAQNADLARARAAQLRRALGHQNGDWPIFESASATLFTLLEAIPTRGAASDVLSRAAQIDFESLRDNLAIFRRYEGALEAKTSALLSAHGLLAHPDFVASPELGAARASLLERLGAGESALFDDDLSQNCTDFARTYSEDYALWHNAQNDAARWNGWRRLIQSDEVRALERLATIQNRAFGTDIREHLDAELQNRCPRDGSLAPGEAVCSSCGLRLGQRLNIRDKGEIEVMAEQELGALHRALQEKSPRDFMMRANSPFTDWNGDSETLLPLLSAPNLRLLDAAFAPRRRVLRSQVALMEALKLSLTRGEMEAAFQRWLDGGDNLGSEDEVELEA